MDEDHYSVEISGDSNIVTAEKNLPFPCEALIHTHSDGNSIEFLSVTYL